MTQFTQGKPSRMRSVYGHNEGTTAEDVYTCPPNCVAEVTFIHVVNGGASTRTVVLGWYVAADDHTSLFLSDKSLATDTYVTFNDISLVLQAGDKIRVTPSATGHIDTIITATETFIPVG